MDAGELEQLVLLVADVQEKMIQHVQQLEKAIKTFSA